MTHDITRYGECVLGLMMPDTVQLRYYGVFANGTEAKAWMDKQYAEGLTEYATFVICPLRDTTITRTSQDWWMRDELQSDEWFRREYPNYRWDDVATETDPITETNTVSDDKETTMNKHHKSLKYLDAMCEAYERGKARGTHDKSEGTHNPEPLSGEWAGESMQELLGDLADKISVDHPDNFSDLCEAYEDGYEDGYTYSSSQERNQ